MTDRTKLHGVAASGEAHPPIGGQGGQIGRGSEEHYAEDTEVGADLRGDTGVLSF